MEYISITLPLTAQVPTSETSLSITYPKSYKLSLKESIFNLSLTFILIVLFFNVSLFGSFLAMDFIVVIKINLSSLINLYKMLNLSCTISVIGDIFVKGTLS